MTDPLSIAAIAVSGLAALSVTAFCGWKCTRQSTVINNTDHVTLVVTGAHSDPNGTFNAQEIKLTITERDRHTTSSTGASGEVQVAVDLRMKSQQPTGATAATSDAGNQLPQSPDTTTAVNIAQPQTIPQSPQSLVQAFSGLLHQLIQVGGSSVTKVTQSTQGGTSTTEVHFGPQPHEPTTTVVGATDEHHTQ